VDSSGNAYVSGTTGSTDFPVKSSFQATLGGGADAFITKFDAAGVLAYSSYLGGLGDESEGGNSLAIDSSGNVYVAGMTNSNNFPTKNPLQANLGGGTDAFVVKVSPAAPTGADLSVAIAAFRSRERPAAKSHTQSQLQIMARRMRPGFSLLTPWPRA
jgi:beta-propeller repeat-containing protein